MDSIPFFIAPGLAAAGLSIGSYFLYHGIIKHDKAYRRKGAAILILTITSFLIYLGAFIYIGIAIKGFGDFYA